MRKGLLLSLLFILLFNVLSFCKQIGNASFYNKKLIGHHTSDGGKYHPDSMTCAHRTFPFGTILKVRNPKNDREVIVKVTDRGPHRRHVLIDLSYSAANMLDMISNGVTKVEITKLDSMPDLQNTILPTFPPLADINKVN